MTNYQLAYLTHGKYNIQVIPLIGMREVEEVNRLIDEGWLLEKIV